ncbi:MAG TPA: DUF4157 domain-containing protein [Chitinophagaceae bacterium]|nr:DUF4157 domain-containing protein [Chitinophagaceae bacterium]
MNTTIHTSKPGKQKNDLPAKPLFFQPKLTINKPNDIYEQEADAVAEKIMRMPAADTANAFFRARPLPASSLQKKCAHCQEEEKLQMKGEGSVVDGMTAPPLVHDVIHSGGQPLDTGTKNFMESRFGYDFSNVQIHNDSIAQQSSASINALAYTHGNHVVFGGGQYQPGSDSGKQLLAHELAHVVQQSNVMQHEHINCSPDKTAAKPKTGTSAKIEIGNINTPNTPKGINRIIPRKEIEVDIKLTPGAEASPVTLSIAGAGNDNGSAKINGVDSYEITASEKIILKGADQTEPGHAGKLSLVAKQGDKVLKKSNAFSVAAYPISLGFNFRQYLLGAKIPKYPGRLFWGAAYEMRVGSDSDTTGDCNKTTISENIIVVNHTGFFKGLKTETSDFTNSTARQDDNHAEGAKSAAVMKEEIDAADIDKSDYSAQQFFRFSCQRTGIKENKAKGPKVPVSGFKIAKKVGKYFFTTQKEGVDNNGVTAGAVNNTSVLKSAIS